MTDLQIEIMKAKIDLWRQVTEIQLAAYNAQVELYKAKIDGAISAVSNIEIPTFDMPIVPDLDSPEIQSADYAPPINITVED